MIRRASTTRQSTLLAPLVKAFLLWQVPPQPSLVVLPLVVSSALSLEVQLPWRHTPHRCSTRMPKRKSNSMVTSRIGYKALRSTAANAAIEKRNRTGADPWSGWCFEEACFCLVQTGYRGRHPEGHYHSGLSRSVGAAVGMISALTEEVLQSLSTALAGRDAAR